MASEREIEAAAKAILMQSTLLDVQGYELARAALEAAEKVREVSGDTSDGYHTFNELYEHRHTLFAMFVALVSSKCWKSKLHDDGTMFDGWFIAGAELPSGYVSYHIPMRLWDLFLCKEIPNAPTWDGHTSDDVIKRFQVVINTSP